MAAGGYPEKYVKGNVITGLPDHETEGLKAFHAGTKLQDGKVVTNGGRVLCVTALGKNVSQAQKNAYDLVRKISWDNVYFRTDIGYRAVAREKK
jgi:phosphoribosylamine--glycine ligase